MSRRDIHSHVDAVQSLAPASRNAAVAGAGVDLKGFNAAQAVIQAGAISGTSPSFTFELQESDDDSAYTAVEDADLQGSEPVLTAGNQVARVGYIGNKQYIRVAITDVSGTSPSLLCAAAINRGLPSLAPIS